MTVYLVEVLFIAVFGLTVKPYLNQQRKLFFLGTVFVVLTVVSGLRAFSVGMDTRHYVTMFRNADLFGVINTRIEIGFVLFVKFLHFFSDDPQILLFASSAICIGSACLFSFLFSKDTILSMLLYVLMGSYFSQMTAMRQTLALSLTMLSFAITLTSERRLKRVLAVLLIILASSIHTVAIIALLPFFLIVFKKMLVKEGKRTAEIGFIQSVSFAIIAFLGYSIIMRLAALLFPGYIHYFSGTWSDANYNASLFNSLIALSFMVFGAIIFRNRELNSTQSFGVVMISLSFIFSVLSMRMEIWNRVTGFFSIYTYLLWAPEFVSAAHSAKQKRILKDIIVLAAFVYMIVVQTFRPEWAGVVPYVFFQT